MFDSLRRAWPAIILLSAFSVGNVSAQDIFRSAAQSTRSYNYIEAQYLANVDQISPFFVKGLLDLNGSFALTGRYTNQRSDFT